MTRRAQFGWGAALALPFLCRSIGATLVVSSLWALHRNRRPLRWYAAGAACAAAPWILWSLAGRGIWDRNPVDGYYTDYLGCWSSTGLAMVGRVFSRNLLMTAHGTGELPLEGLSASLAPWLGHGVTSVLMIIVGLAAWLAMIGDLRRNRALAWMLAGYLGAMLVWSWPPYRFLVPIMPLLVAYMLLAPATILQAVSKPKRQRGTVPTMVTRGATTVPCSEDCAKSGQSPSVFRLAAAMCLGAIVLANGVLLARHAEQVRDTGYPLARLSDAPVHWSSYERTFAWLRQYSEPQDVVASGLDSMVALYTDLRAFRPFVYDPGRLFYGEGQGVLLAPPELAAILKRYRPRYLVQSPMPGFMEEHPLAKLVDELRQHYPDWLKVAYQDSDPRFVVYELDARHEPSEQ